MFERDGDRGLFSIAKSELSGAGGDPDWQRVEFSPAEFAAAVTSLRASFVAELRSASPEAAEAWLAPFAPEPNHAEPTDDAEPDRKPSGTNPFHS